MKRTIGLALAIAVISIVAFANSARALSLDFVYIINDIQETDVEITGNLSDYVQPWINVIFTNDGTESITLDFDNSSYYNAYGGLLTQFNEELFETFTIIPGETREIGFLKVGPYVFDFDSNAYEIAKVGDYSTIGYFSIQYNDGAYCFEKDDPGWTVTVVEANNNGGGTSPVPEPTTLLLFGAGLAGLAAVGRRKK